LIQGALAPSRSAETVDTFDIVFDQEAVAHIHAIVDLSGAPNTVLAVLTDYAHWPILFPGMRLGAIRQDADGVITEMDLPMAVLPGTIHLVIRTRLVPPNQIDAELVSGDLQRFWRRWRVTPLPTPHITRAELQMVMQPKGWAPQWLVRYGIEIQLKDHFHRLATVVEAHERNGS
jgi:hypothetical protein